jgi:hypothetical protein
MRSGMRILVPARLCHCDSANAVGEKWKIPLPSSEISGLRTKNISQIAVIAATRHYNGRNPGLGVRRQGQLRKPGNSDVKWCTEALLSCSQMPMQPWNPRNN